MDELSWMSKRISKGKDTYVVTPVIRKLPKLKIQKIYCRHTDFDPRLRNLKLPSNIYWSVSSKLDHKICDRLRELWDLERQGRHRSDIKYGSSCCSILKTHADILKDDPERLSTEFIKRLSKCNCEEDV